MSDENPLPTRFQKQLKEIRIKNLNKIIIAQININSLRNKFEMLAEGIGRNSDILLVSCTI